MSKNLKLLIARGSCKFDFNFLGNQNSEAAHVRIVPITFLETIEFTCTLLAPEHHSGTESAAC